MYFIDLSVRNKQGHRSEALSTFIVGAQEWQLAYWRGLASKSKCRKGKGKLATLKALLFPLKSGPRQC